MLCLHKYLLKKIGVNHVYRLWLIFPVGLLFFNVPMTWQLATVVEQPEILRFMVGSLNSVTVEDEQMWFVVVWLMVSSVITLSGLISYGFSKRYFRLEKTLSSAIEQQHFSVILPKNLDLYQSSYIASPMLLGLFSQRLVIPNNFQQLYNQEQQQLILEHEICHFDRNDIYWNLLAFGILALFWFHPLVWLAYFRYRRDQELSCDNIVLARKNMTSRINYSKALLVTAETSFAFAFAQLSFKKYGDKDIMFERIKQIQLDTKASLISLLTVSFLAVSLLSGLSYAGNVSNNEVDTKYRVPPQATVPLKPIHRVEPQYPEKAVVEKIEGGVVLKFDVDNDGYVKNVEVINGEPAYVFDRVASAALRQWKYVSTGQYHKNQLVQLDFRLDKNSAYPDKNLIEKIQVIQ
jgi:TonB family protein